MLFLPADADAANAMLQALWESGIGLSAVVPATRENIVKELPWLAWPEKREKPQQEKSADWDLSLWTSIFCAGALAGMALVELARWL
jgi:hypothetical protein